MIHYTTLTHGVYDKTTYLTSEIRALRTEMSIKLEEALVSAD